MQKAPSAATSWLFGHGATTGILNSLSTSEHVRRHAASKEATRHLTQHKAFGRGAEPSRLNSHGTISVAARPTLSFTRYIVVQACDGRSGTVQTSSAALCVDSVHRFDGRRFTVMPN